MATMQIIMRVCNGPFLTRANHTAVSRKQRAGETRALAAGGVDIVLRILF